MSYVGGVSIAGTTHPVAHSLFGICTTEATEAEKVITCPSFDHLATGVSINVLFMRGNGNLHPTANVNGTGALPLVAWVADEQAEPSEGDGDGEGGGSTDTLVAWHAGSVLTLTYDGAHWVAHGGSTAGGGGEQDLSPIYDQIDVLFAAVDSARDDTNAVMEALEDYALDADLDMTDSRLMELLHRILIGMDSDRNPYIMIRTPEDTDSATGTTIDTTGAATIRSLTIHGQSVQDGTPAPDAPVPIVSVESRNLASDEKLWYTRTASSEFTAQGITVKQLGDGLYSAMGTTTGTGDIWFQASSLDTALSRDPGDYVMSVYVESGTWPSRNFFLQLAAYKSSNNTWSRNIRTANGSTSQAFTCTSDYPRRFGFYSNTSGVEVNITFRLKLERGTTAHPYQPYGCVTLVAGNTRTDIDLQGHALRSLPDGTRDEMAVDSLGRVTMTQRVGVTTTATTDGITATVGVDAMSTTGDLSDGATVIYPLATPQTIDLGTIDLPAPADTLWLDAAIVPTIEATWYRPGNGRNDGNYLKITNEEVGLVSDNIEVATAIDGKFVVPHATVLADEQLGDWLWRQRGNGHLTLTYEGSGS